MSDEGLYLLLADPNQPNFSGLLGYDLFFKFINRTFGWQFSLIQLRILRWLSILIAAWLLSKWLIKKWPWEISQSYFFLISYLGLITSYSFLPPTLSYNSLALFLACCWLYFGEFPNSKLTSSLFTGAILSLLIYVKLPIAIILFGLSCLGILRSSNTFFLKGLQIFMLGLPLVSLELLLISTLKDSFFLRLTEALSLILSRPDYSLPLLVKINLVGWIWIFIAVLIGCISGKMSTIGKTKFKFSILVLVCGFFVISWFTHITEEWNHLFILALVLVLAFFFGKGNLSFLRNSNFLLLLFLPFALHFGSNVYFLRLAVLFGVFWILAVSLLMQHGSEKFQLLFHIFLSASILILVFIGVWYAPFGHHQPLWKSQTPFAIPDNSSIFLDSALAKTLNEIQIQVPENPSILAAYRNPGIPFLLGKTIPHSPGFWDASQLIPISSMSQQPELIIFSSYDLLPNGWQFCDTLGSWTLENHSIYLLSQ